jgi:methyl-accepting chemotaxis protein
MNRMRLADLPLIVKIAFAPAIALLMMAVIAFFSVMAQRQSTADLREAVHVGMAESLQMQAISERITETHGRLYMLLTHQAGKIDAEKLDAQTKNLLTDLTEIQKDIKSMAAAAVPAEQAKFVKLGKQLEETRSAVDLVGSMMTADFSAAASFVAPFEQSYKQMVATLADVVKTTQDDTRNHAAESEARAARTEWIMGVSALLTLLLVAAMAFASVWATRKDILRIAAATEKLAAGDNSIDLDAMARRDELGAIVRSLTVFRDNQLRIVQLRKQQEASETAAAAERAAREREQTLVMTTLATGLDHLAAGDLAYRVTAEFPGEYSTLRDDFNKAMGQLDETVRVITDVTVAMQAETDDKTGLAGAKGASGKAATLQQTGTALVRALEAFRAHQRRMVEMRKEHEALQESRTQEQALVVSTLAEAMDRLAAGDLTYRMNVEFPGEYRALRDDFNNAMHQLEDTLRTIGKVTEVIKTGSGEISQASDNLSQRTEHQAATLEQTAAAIDEITATVRSSAEGAASAREAVSQAKNDASGSGRIVKDAVSAMEDIKNSSVQIGQIVGAIDEIAFQTNLLSLNAGIEAARAGDAGRGFAVVATEVRALAQRSAEMAKQIKTLIGDSNTKVIQGVSLVGETGKALERIAAQVISINDVIEQIASSAKEQATGLNQINTSMNDMDSVTQQNAAMVQQTTAASHSLAGEAGELALLLGRFKVKGGGSTAASKPTLVSTAAKSNPEPVRKVAAGGSNVAERVREQSAAPESNWKEF